MPRSRLTGGAVAACVAVTLSACAYSSEETPQETSVETAPEAQSLADVCPANVGIQLQWQPQSDMGAVFGLLGPGYQVDTEDKSVTGPLVAAGKDTGVDLTLKSGGPAIGFQSVPSQLYVDDTLVMGIVHGDQLIAAAADQPVIGVTPLLKYSPAILMWDPASHPDWQTVADIGTTDATVVVSKDQIFPQWMVGKGMLQQSQIDTSYDGAPARFVGDPSIAQQGFANSEPYTYEHDTPSWDKPVGYGLIKDVGYDIYASNMSVRADKLDELAPCLEKLVPIIQQSGVDYAAAPEAVNKVIVDVVSQDSTYSPYSEGEAAFSADLLVDKGLLAAEDDGSFGVYDPARTARNVEDLRGVLAGSGNVVPAEMTGDTLFTNRFSDPSIATN
ncbi:nitrate ABC transporter substrate-binding protein [Mycolicibacterium murale]|uniref:Nitrate ABC transporter substrate-binding protein n=1 Tax=Mycolicibacterium murale TaxID=182220 RepID=A0A7I9WMQ1_9MYCO|nr:nitrate ABC transporter substrate-binding protein [Mycolicibacterium murale]MCV7181223.1 nitrate ABC transporter substrate-binding protein [Mycolicibacterium murale]GFG58628.1 nitrate ABC transporter substrate-binding protein [Mycolicibacterium murale]